MNMGIGKYIGAAMIFAGVLVQGVGWLGVIAAQSEPESSPLLPAADAAGKDLAVVPVVERTAVVEEINLNRDSEGSWLIFAHEGWVDSFLSEDVAADGEARSSAAVIAGGEIDVMQNTAMGKIAVRTQGADQTGDTVISAGENVSSQRLPSVLPAVSSPDLGSGDGDVGPRGGTTEVADTQRRDVAAVAKERKLRDTQWVKGHRADRFTIQIRSGVSDRELKLYRDNPIFPDPMAAIVKKGEDDRGGKARYVVIAGDYPSYEAAKTSASNLVAQIPGFRPWVRNFGLLQAQVGG